MKCCKVCGTLLNPDDKFCTVCGTKYEELKEGENTVPEAYYRNNEEKQKAMEQSAEVLLSNKEEKSKASIVFGIISLCLAQPALIMGIIYNLACFTEMSEVKQQVQQSGMTASYYEALYEEVHYFFIFANVLTILGAVFAMVFALIAALKKNGYKAGRVLGFIALTVSVLLIAAMVFLDVVYYNPYLEDLEIMINHYMNM